MKKTIIFGLLDLNALILQVAICFYFFATTVITRQLICGMASNILNKIVNFSAAFVFQWSAFIVSWRKVNGWES